LRIHSITSEAKHEVYSVTFAYRDMKDPFLSGPVIWQDEQQSADISPDYSAPSNT